MFLINTSINMKTILLIIFLILQVHITLCQNNKQLILPSIVSNNMVLQQKSNVPIWGWAIENEEVKINASWLDNPIVVKADKNGRWEVKLPTNNASIRKYSISINSLKDTVTISSILFGEVWLASGQSNMTMPLKGWGEQNIEGAEEAIKNSSNPEIRLFQVRQNATPAPLDDCEGLWVESNPVDVANFSATAYFFAEKLNRELGIPIGIIHSSWGGTKAQAWIKKENLLEMDDFNHEIKNLESDFSLFKEELVGFEKAMKYWGEFDKYDPTINYSTYIKKKDKAVKKWKKEVKNCKCDVPPNYPKPILPKKFPQFMVTTLYNAMINPLLPFAIKGVIWYQGEGNSYNAEQYLSLFPLVINNWRKDWGQGSFPFYFVQIAPYPYEENEEGKWDKITLRDAQLQTMSNVENVGMVVTTDIGDTARVHPAQKREVGERLALWALAKNYNRDVVCSGPIYKSMRIEKNKIRLFFDYAEIGLKSDGKNLTYFEIADKSKNYVKAEAQIDGSTVIVSNPKISNPKYVRFGWEHTAQPNLFNSVGLPASPFKTD